MKQELHIALLRGINVGGKNKLPMADLKAIFERLGCTRVRTYIQSGNVVFEPGTDSSDALGSAISAEIEKDFGYRIPVVLRTGSDFRRVVATNPFLSRTEDIKTLSVGFLSSTPSEEHVAQLDPDRSPPDQFSVDGREIYLWYPNGLARSKLTNAYFDSKLKTVSTVRNWRTTLKLLELSGG